HLPPGESHTNFRYLSGGVLSVAGNIRPDPYRAGTDERLRNPRQRIDAPASIVTKARHYPWFFESAGAQMVDAPPPKRRLQHPMAMASTLVVVPRIRVQRRLAAVLRRFFSELAGRKRKNSGG